MKGNEMPFLNKAAFTEFLNLLSVCMSNIKASLFSAYLSSERLWNVLAALETVSYFSFHTYKIETYWQWCSLPDRLVKVIITDQARILGHFVHAPLSSYRRSFYSQNQPRLCAQNNQCDIMQTFFVLSNHDVKVNESLVHFIYFLITFIISLILSSSKHHPPSSLISHRIFV